MKNLLLFISLICSYFLLYGPNGGGEDESLLMQLNILVQEGKTQDVEQFVKMMHFGDFSRLFIDTAVQQNEPWLRTGFKRFLAHNSDQKIEEMLTLLVNYSGFNKNKALAQAADYGSFNTVKLLLEKGADVNAENPLQNALLGINLRNFKSDDPQKKAYCTNSYKIANYLLDKGAKVSNNTDYISGCLADYSSEGKEMFKKLLAKGAALHYTDNITDDPYRVSYEGPINIDRVNKIVFNVIKAGDVDFFKFLAEHGADLNLSVKDVPLIIIAIGSDFLSPDLKVTPNPEIISTIIKKNPKSVLAQSGWSPLVAAIRLYGPNANDAQKKLRMEIVKEIFDAIPPQNVIPELGFKDRGATAKEWAINARDPQLLNLVIQAEAHAKDLLKPKK